MVDQTSQFYAILTNVGAAKQANADALGIAWKITQMGVGDANGTDPTPNATQTSLINEWRRAPLNQLKVDDKNSAIIIAEQVIPADVGGKWIREIALYDADGDMVAVANCAPTYKPLLSQGSGRTQVVRMNLVVSSASNVQLKIDPAVVLATREWVTEELARQDFKHSVLVATTANIALAGLQTIDGVALTAGVRVLVKNQTAAKDNGLYLVVASGEWTRCADADSSAKVTPGMLVLVEKGMINGDSAWQLVTDTAISIGVTALAYEMAFGRTGVANGTYRSVTVDTYGRVTGATNPTTVSGYGLTDVYTRSELDQALMLKAPLASPALTGVPTAPTPAQGTNSTQLANTAFVQTAISALIAAAPGALDTLNELAAALGNDPNFAATMANALALKAPLSSPTLIGTPTAPTAALLDMSQKLATTDFVKQAGWTMPSGTATIAIGETLTPYCIGRITYVSGTGAWAGAVTLPVGAPLGSVFTIAHGNGQGTLTVNAPASPGSYIAMGTVQYTSMVVKYTEGPLVLVCVFENVYVVLSGGNSSAFDFKAVMTQGGYIRSPGGMLRQWGSASVPTNGTLEVTFPIAFGEQCFGAICQYTTGLGSVAGRCGAGPVSLSKLRLESAVPSASGMQNIYWEAWGK